MGRILKILVGVLILAGLTAGGYAWVTPEPRYSNY